VAKLILPKFGGAPAGLDGGDGFLSGRASYWLRLCRLAVKCWGRSYIGCALCLPSSGFLFTTADLRLPLSDDVNGKRGAALSGWRLFVMVGVRSHPTA